MPVGDSTPHGPVLYEARPTGEKVLKDWVLPLAASVVLAPFVLKWKDPTLETRWIVVAVGIMLVLVSLLVLLLWLRKSRALVQVTPTHVVRTRATGRDTVSRAQLTEAVLAQRYLVPGVSSPVLFLTDESTSTRLQLSAPVWTEEELSMIGQSAQHLTVIPTLTPQEGSSRWPQMMPWSHRHPYGAMALGGLGTLLFLGLIAVVAIALT